MRRSRESTRARNHRWNELPYGLWRCANGREVLFNRRYQPIYERYDGITVPALRDEWVRFTAQYWFYDDGTIPTRLRLERIVESFGNGDDMRRWFNA